MWIHALANRLTQVRPLVGVGAAVLSWLALFPMHVFERWVNQRPTPVCNGISSRLDDMSLWNTLTVVVAYASVLFAKPSVDSLLQTRYRIGNGHTKPRRLPEFLLALLVTAYAADAFIRKNNLFRWRNDAAHPGEVAKQLLEGLMCLSFIFLAYSCLKWLDEVTHLLHWKKQLANRVPLKTKWLLRMIAGGYSIVVLSAGLGLYVGLLGSQLHREMPCWKDPDLFDFGGQGVLLKSLLFVANFMLYLSCVLVGQVLVAIRIK